MGKKKHKNLFKKGQLVRHKSFKTSLGIIINATPECSDDCSAMVHDPNYQVYWSANPPPSMRGEWFSDGEWYQETWLTSAQEKKGNDK